MFIVLPIGHDRPVYDRPWVTISLITACVGIFLASEVLSHAAMRELTAAANEVDAISANHPDARITFTIEGLPQPLRPIIDPLIDTRPDRRPQPGDAELDQAMRRLIAAMNRLPELRFGYRPGHPTVLGAIGHMFMHGGYMHLFGNMLFLWVAGGVLECFWRRWAYVGLYFLSGLAGLAAHHLSQPHSLVPLVGASGAIAGLIGAFVVSYPQARVRLGYFVWLIVRPLYGSWYIKAWIVIPLWALSELLHALLAGPDGVAYWAHVGGFGCGVLAGIVGRLAGWIAVDAGHEPMPLSPAGPPSIGRAHAAMRATSDLPPKASAPPPMPDPSDFPEPP
ncbi:MAG: rhomboid family intramembrane serine protease [Sandaracinaceae bacterium]